MCSCLDQLVSIFILLLELHFLSSQLGLEVIHLSEEEMWRPRGQQDVSSCGMTVKAGDVDE